MLVMQIEVGGMYVSEKTGLLRVAQSFPDKGRVQWRDFGLEDGKPIGDGCCRLATFQNWTDRPATEVERARVRWDLARLQDIEHLDGLLKLIPDLIIDNEHDQRGLFDHRIEVMLASEFLAPKILTKASDHELIKEFRRRGLPLSLEPGDGQQGATSTGSPETVQPTSLT